MRHFHEVDPSKTASSHGTKCNHEAVKDPSDAVRSIGNKEQGKDVGA